MHHTGKTYDIIKYTDPWYLRKEIHKQKHNKVLTVLAPVIWAKASCNLLPSSCSSSSMTLYVAPISLNTLFAILQYGHVVLENITTQCCDTNSWKVWGKKIWTVSLFHTCTHYSTYTHTKVWDIWLKFTEKLHAAVISCDDESGSRRVHCWFPHLKPFAERKVHNNGGDTTTKIAMARYRWSSFRCRLGLTMSKCERRDGDDGFNTSSN